MVVKITDPNTKEVWEYYLDKRLKLFLDEKVKKRIEKNDKDYVLLVDGYEGSGKSTWALQVGRYVDPKLSLDRVCMTAEDFKNAIINAEKGQCVIYDEAVTGLSASGSITKIGKLLKSMMMQMRQKNLFVIVIIPSVFEFNKYAVLNRARAFFHIYESKGRMGFFVGYNKKDTRMTYLKGKRTHSYTVRTKFLGRFYGKYTIDEEAYRKKKEEALFLIDEEDEVHRWKEQRDVIIKFLYKNTDMNYRQISEVFDKADLSISVGQIGLICKKVRKTRVT